MREPNYKETLLTSWHLVSKHKALWVFGLFSAFLGPVGIVSVMQKIGLTGTTNAFFPLPLVLPEFFTYGTLSLGLPIDAWMVLLWLLTIIVGAGLFVFFVGGISQGAIVHSVAQYETWGARDPNIAQAWHAGASHVWRILGINIVVKVVVTFLGLVMAFASINAILQPSVFDSVSFVLLFILSAIVGVVVSLVSIYAIGYVVVEEYRLADAIAGGWKLFLSHWLVSLEIGFILLLLNTITGFVLIASLFVLMIPTIVLWIIALSALSKAFGLFAFIIGISMFTIFFVLVVSFLTAFSLAAWTHLFMKMHRHGLKSGILSWSRFHS